MRMVMWLVRVLVCGWVGGFGRRRRVGCRGCEHMELVMAGHGVGERCGIGLAAGECVKLNSGL
jgi:hypothetical protein